LIADFGISKMIGKDGKIKKAGGTLVFQPPEIWNTSLPKTGKIDIWSLGITFFFIRYGFLPFYDLDSGRLKRKIEQNEVVFPGPKDSGFEDVISLCLRKHPDERASLYQIMKHNWVTKNGSFPLTREKKEKLFLTGEEISNAFTLRKIETNIFAVSKLKATFFRQKSRKTERSDLNLDKVFENFSEEG